MDHPRDHGHGHADEHEEDLDLACCFAEAAAGGNETELGDPAENGHPEEHGEKHLAEVPGESPPTGSARASRYDLGRRQPLAHGAPFGPVLKTRKSLRQRKKIAVSP